MMEDHANGVVAARYWHAVSGGKIQCDLCPRECKLQDGQRGFCFVRARQDDGIVLTTYGRSSGFCVDPIEKKPLNHFVPGSSVLSFGTAGCNLGCKFCQNWDISRSREMDRLADRASPKQIADTARNLGCRSVAFTYNDPVIFLEYAVDVARECRKIGVKTVAVTAGYISPEPRKEFFSVIDAANVDLKGFTEEFYRNFCSARLAPVLDTLTYIKHETDVWLEITNLLIPDENDSQGEIEAMVDWIAVNLGVDVPIHFTAFHPDYKMRDKDRTSSATLRRAREAAINRGLNYVYTGNVRDKEGSTTRCSNCHSQVIERDGYEITDYQLDEKGRCLVCGSLCPGVFDGPVESWGSKRQPVRLG